MPMAPEAYPWLTIKEPTAERAPSPIDYQDIIYYSAPG